MKSAESLELLSRFPRELNGAWPSQHFDVMEIVPNLHRLPEALVQDKTVPIKPPMDIEMAKRLWSEAGHKLGNLSPRVLATLCLEPDIATDPRFLEGFADHPKLGSRARCVLAMINGYFSRWRSMPNPYQMEHLLQNLVAADHHWGRTAERYRTHAKRLFSSEAARLLSEQIIARRCAIDDELVQWGVPPSGGLPTAVADAAVSLWSHNLASLLGRAPSTALEQELNYGFCKLLPDARVGDSFYTAMSDILLHSAMERPCILQDIVKRYVLSTTRLGDPRLPRAGPNWRRMKESARRRVLSWLARESITFFFDFILPKESDAKERKVFWLKYCDRVVDFQVALCSDDETRLRSRFRSDQMPSYSRIGSGDTSAFLLKFAGLSTSIVVAEFSKIGNAAYIHSGAEFERTIGDLHQNAFRVGDQLKHGDFSARILHMSGWQPKARQRLARLGIYPSS